MTAIYRNDSYYLANEDGLLGYVHFFSLVVQFLAIMRYLRPDRVHYVYRTKNDGGGTTPLFAYSFNPVKSIPTTGSFPTTQALCPGGITAASPGPNSSSAPSSMTTLILPETMYWV